MLFSSRETSCFAQCQYSIIQLLREGDKHMSLMEREYMGRSPEERAAAHSPELKKHLQRQQEMYDLMAKGNNLSHAERKRLKQIFKENKAYMDKQSTPGIKPAKSTSKIVPILIFLLVILIIVLIFTYYPQLGNLNLWK